MAVNARFLKVARTRRWHVSCITHTRSRIPDGDSRYLSIGESPSRLDAFAITSSYFTIIVLAPVVAVVVTFTLTLLDKKGTLANAGAPPSTQVLVDVLGIVVTCLICEALLGQDFANSPP